MPLSRFLLNPQILTSLMTAGMIFLCLIMAGFGLKMKENPGRRNFLQKSSGIFYRWVNFVEQRTYELIQSHGLRY